VSVNVPSRIKLVRCRASEVRGTNPTPSPRSRWPRLTAFGSTESRRGSGTSNETEIEFPGRSPPGPSCQFSTVKVPSNVPDSRPNGSGVWTYSDRFRRSGSSGRTRSSTDWGSPCLVVNVPFTLTIVRPSPSRKRFDPCTFIWSMNATVFGRTFSMVGSRLSVSSNSTSRSARSLWSPRATSTSRVPRNVPWSVPSASWKPSSTFEKTAPSVSKSARRAKATDPPSISPSNRSVISSSFRNGPPRTRKRVPGRSRSGAISSICSRPSSAFDWSGPPPHAGSAPRRSPQARRMQIVRIMEDSSRRGGFRAAAALGRRVLAHFVSSMLSK